MSTEQADREEMVRLANLESCRAALKYLATLEDEDYVTAMIADIRVII